MQYAKEQMIRPKIENGCDYGAGRRSVLVARADGRQVLHVAGFSFGSRALSADYQPSRVELWSPDQAKNYSARTAIHEGRIKATDWTAMAPKIYDHLGMEFPISYIGLHATLLLDESGTIDDQSMPPKPASPKKPQVELRSKTWHRFGRGEDDGPLQHLIYEVIGRKGNKVEMRRIGKNFARTFDIRGLEQEGMGATPEEARQLWMDIVAGSRIKEAEQRIRKAQEEIEYQKGEIAEYRTLLGDNLAAFNEAFPDLAI